MFYFLFFFGVGCVLSFPLEDCNMKKLHFRFILDCRYDVEEQMNIFNQTKYFFETEREWNIPKFTLMTYSDKGIYRINATDVMHMNETCPDRLPFENITNQSQTWSQSQSKSIRITVMFVSLFNNCNVLDKNMTNFLNIEKQFFFFILKSLASYSFKTKYMLHLKSFNAFNSEGFYSKVCSIKCQKQPHSFMIENLLRSYYHLAENLTMSSNEARQYCAQNQSSYLLSLETYDEMEFIFRTFEKQGIIMHVGLNKVSQGKHMFKWASSNPFILKYNFYSQWYDIYDWNMYAKRCFIISNKKFDNETFLSVGSKINLTFYIKDVDCDKPIQHALVICECHFPFSNNHITLETREKEDLILHLQYFVQFQLMVKSKYVNIINCFIHFHYSNESLIQNVCSKYIESLVKFHRNVVSDVSIIHWINGFLSRYHFRILKLVNISSCKFNDYCQKSDTWLNCVRNANSCEECLEDRDKCFQRLSLIETNLEKFTCEIDSEDMPFRCIEFRFGYCIDNSLLQHCENFTCPYNSVKCYRSYCIPLDMIDDGEPDCPHGEDELVKSNVGIDTQQCLGNFLAYLKDLCFLFYDIIEMPFSIDNKFFCSPACPKYYKCFSHRRLKDDNISLQSIEMYKFHVPLYNISNSYVTNLAYKYFPILNIIELSVQKCNVENFDLAFKTWRLSKLLELDLSYNNLKSSDEMNLIRDMIKLTFLNLSNNPSLRVEKSFTFPENLETIDLSYTSFKSIDGNTFLNLKYLKFIDLSGTEIAGFKDLGIPKFYTLDLLYLQHLKISQIQQDFFEGLTIRTGLWTSDFRLCCPQILNANISVEKCHGPTDAISSCKHLIGDVFKRLVIWVVGILTVLGNGIVLIYRLVYHREIFKKAYGLFVTGLALSDFVMGIYLLIIASVDIDYKDMYVLEETNWRNGMLCQISGFLSTLSSETSTFFICLITLDRYLKISYPFGEYKLSKTLTCVLFTLAWLVGIVLAAVPIVISSWEIYSTNGLCLALPFSSIRFSGWEFTFVVYIGVNFVLFLLIAVGQVAIFVNITRRKQLTPSLKNCPIRRSEDLAVARKLAFVAMSDFLCWFPIGIIGILSMNGHTFDREVYAWFAVFVLPINSALNPIIYTIPTLYARCKQNIQHTTETKSSSFLT